MSEVFADWCKESTATTGTGTITLAGATASDLAPLSKVVADGDIVPYSVLDDNGNRENGLGTYTLSGTTLARTTILSTWVSSTSTYDDTSPAAISLSGDAEVYVCMSRHQAMSKTDTKYTNMLYKDSATLNGTAINNHVNLGSGTSITGTAAQAYDYCVVGGGKDNSVTREYSTCSGGNANSVLGPYDTISGGRSNNTALIGIYNTVAGGWANSCSSANSGVISGGRSNYITGSYSLITGGFNNQVDGDYAAVLSGHDNFATGDFSAALNKGTKTNHTHSISAGGGSLTRANYDLVWGATDTTTAAVANNTIRLQGTGGNIKIDGAVSSPEADPADMFEWFDGNPDNEDRTGYFVSLYKGKIVKGAGRQDKSSIANYIASMFSSPNSPTNVIMIGATSSAPSVIGNAAPNGWTGRHVKDKFNRRKEVSYSLFKWVDGFGEEQKGYRRNSDGAEFSEYPQYSHKGIPTVIPTDPTVTLLSVVAFPEVSADFDPDAVYVPRDERKEWDPVGMIGILIVHSAEPITSDWVRSSVDGRALNASAGVGYQVIKVIDNYTVQVYIK